jgi:hypothetical protein
LIRSLEDRLQGIQDEPHQIQNPNSPREDHHKEVMRELEQLWRSILKIDSVLEKVKNYHIFLLYIFSGLITTSIVTTFTLTVVTKSVPLTPSSQTPTLVSTPMPTIVRASKFANLPAIIKVV